MLEKFTKLFHLLEALCCQLDLELASLTTEFDSSNFSTYSDAAFSLFGNCHNICDRKFIDEAHAQALDKVSNDFCAICL